METRAEVFPVEISFGRVLVGGVKARAVSVINFGGAPISVMGVDVLGDQFSASWVERRFSPGAGSEVSLTFSPTLPGPASATAFIRTDALVGALHSVFLSGSGTSEAPGVGVVPTDPLHCDPRRLDFGLVPSGVLAIRWVDCFSDAEIDSVYVAGDGEFHVGRPAPRIGRLTRLPVEYLPLDGGSDVAVLHVRTADSSTDALWLAGHGDAAACSSPILKVDTFEPEGTAQVDLLFVMDNSGSMMEEQEALATGATQLLGRAHASGWDYHAAVTTTGIIEMSPACPGGANGGEAGRFFPVDGSRPRIVTRWTPDPVGVFADNIHVGLCHWLEDGLEAGYLALSEPLVSSTDDPSTDAPNDGNAGFLRPEARLSVVYISDEDDWSRRPVYDYVTHLRGLKGNADLLRVTAIVPDGHCPGTYASGGRYMTVAGDLGGMVLPICAPDWTALLDNLSRGIFPGKSVFALEAMPDPQASSSLTVYVAGMDVAEFAADGSAVWAYDSATNSVSFSVPPAGAVEVIYRVGCR